MVFHDLYDNKNYKKMEIYEIYINELLNIDLNEANRYIKMIIELTSVLVTDDVEKYIKSENETVRKVAERIMKYTEEEIARLQRQYDKECAAEERDIIRLLEKKAEEKGEEKNQIKTIKTMYKNGVTPADIAKYLNLDIDYVKKALNK